MRIAVNTRLLLKDKLEGIGWFTFEVLKRITRDHPEHEFIFIFDRPYSNEFIFSDNVTPVVVGPPARHPFLFYLWFDFRLPRILRQHKVDLFFSPDGYLSLRTPVKQLSVTHDINFIHRPKDLPWLKSAYYNYFFPRFVKRAERVLTVSNYSKEDIVRSLGIAAGKIDVAHNGINSLYIPISEEEKRQTRQKYAGGCDYFLFIGSLHPRKNVSGLLRAYDKFRSETDRPVKLIIAGGQMFKTSEISSIYKEMRHCEAVIFTGRVSTDELKMILGSALCLTFVPFFEGFGIPVIEAMSAGIPVICSNTTSLPEVGGEAVQYVDPSSESQICDAMLRMAEDESLRQDLIAKGFRQKEKFSWDKTAEIVWNSIQICLNS